MRNPFERNNYERLIIGPTIKVKFFINKVLLKISTQSHPILSTNNLLNKLLKIGLCVAMITSNLSFINSDKPLTVELRLSPRFVSGKVVGMEVNYEFICSETGDRKPTGLQLDKLTPLLRETDTIKDLVVQDDKGTIVFRKSKNATAYTSTYETWTAARQMAGKVHVKYFIAAANSDPIVRGPHVDMQISGNGLSGSLNGILLFPNITIPISLHLIWDLPPTLQGVSTFGVGNCSILTNYENLMDAQFITGRLSRYPSGNPSSGFSIFALGVDSNTVFTSAVWPEHTYEAIRNTFHASHDKSFRFFIRSYDGGPLSSGRASEGSFLLYLAPNDSLNDANIRSLIAHEMIHVFVPGFNSSSNADDWYIEGIADYLSFVIPFKSQLYTKAYFIKLLNREAAEYYTNALRRTPNSAVPSMMWSGRNAWTLPYSRGMFYFANLDAKLSKLKNPHQTVVSLISAMNARSNKGDSITAKLWVDLLKDKVGLWAVNDWYKMNNGELIMLDKNSFGSHFIGMKIQAGFFDLGFEQPKTLKKGTKIRGLNRNSAAARVGLRDGDEIAESVNLLPIYQSFDALVTIKVIRDGKLLSFTYSPRTGSHTAMKWQMVN